MKGSVVALGTWRGRRAAAHIVDGELDDLLVDPPDRRPLPGAIHRAVADRPMKGQGGIFVKLADGQQGYLRGAKAVRPGTSLLVQVVSHAEPGKAVPVTLRLLYKSRYAIATPQAPGVNISRQIRDEDLRDALTRLGLARVSDETGLILRSAAGGVDPELVADDIDHVLDQAAGVAENATGSAPECLLDGPDAHLAAWRDWPAPDIVADAEDAFDRHGVDDLIASATAPRLALSGGACAFIEPTRALVAVDVNTGPDGSPAAGLKANLALIRALPRALRCRGLGGQITIDLAPLAKRDRRQIETALKSAFRADPVETAFAGWTPLGHFELQRKRERAPVIRD